MINKAAMFDELAKISADMGYVPPQEYENTVPPTELPPGDRNITKDRLKRGLIAAGVIGAGAAVGHGVGSLAKSYVARHPQVTPYIQKYAPAALGGLTALGGILLAEQRRRADEYITGKKLHA